MTEFSHFLVSLIFYEMLGFAHKAEVLRNCYAELEAADGVETWEQEEILRGTSCEQLQGYLFSRPVEPAEFERLLAEAA